MLAGHLYTAMKTQLKQDYMLVDRAGPGVMRVTVAITEARGSNVVLDVVSTVAPPARLISAGTRLVTGTNAFVGKAAVEGEILDSLSGDRLIAAADERAGAKVLRGSGGTWEDVKESYDYWAERLRSRLAELRTR